MSYKKNNLIKQYISLLVEQQANNSSNNNIQVYLDMDGVLADFDNAVKNTKGYPEAKEQLNGVLRGMPELAKLSEDELKVRLQGPQTDPGLKALKKAFNNYRAKKYEIAGKDGFFLNLPEMPGAQELVKGVAAITGRLPHILTAPMTSSQNCEQEKKAWIEQHFAGLYDGFYCTQEKWKFAQQNKSNVLIDDRTKYTTSFDRAGGTAILYKGNVNDALKQLQDIVSNSGAINTANVVNEVTPMDNINQANNTGNGSKPSISYTALVLSRPDHERLLEAFPVIEGWEPIAHHVTINLGSYKGNNRQALGQKFVIGILSTCSNELVSACRVSLPEGISSANPVPHITMYVNKAAGGKPAMSNKLDWSQEVRLRGALQVQGTLIEVAHGNNEKFSDEY